MVLGLIKRVIITRIIIIKKLYTELELPKLEFESIDAHLRYKKD